MSEVYPNSNLEVDYETIRKITQSNGQCPIKINDACKNVVMIDVRPQDEINANGGMIPCARNLPLNEIEESLSSLDEDQFESKYGFPKPNKEKDCLLFYCKMGGRARKALELSKSLGYTTACYPGSWTEWQSKQ